MDIPDVRPTSAFTREGWSRVELSRALQDNTLERVRRGMYSLVADLDHEQEHARAVAAATERWHDDFVVSHVSAALLHGLPVRRKSLALVHLSGDGHTHGKVTAGVRIHQTPVAEEDVTMVGVLRLTSLERTLADVARSEPFEWGVIAADAVLRRGVGREALSESVDLGRRRRGNARWRQVLAFADARSESALESMSRVSMARAGIPTPLLQMEVTNRHGEWIATGDFGWEHLRVLGEADGKAKYNADQDDGSSAGDIVAAVQRRDRDISSAGWTSTHWGWDLATNHLALSRHLHIVFRNAA